MFCYLEFVSSLCFIYFWQKFDWEILGGPPPSFQSPGEPDPPCIPKFSAHDDDSCNLKGEIFNIRGCTPNSVGLLYLRNRTVAVPWLLLHSKPLILWSVSKTALVDFYQAVFQNLKIHTAPDRFIIGLQEFAIDVANRSHSTFRWMGFTHGQKKEIDC